MNFRKILLGGAVIASAFGLYACGTAEPENPTKQRISAELAPDAVSVPVNGTATLTLEVTPADRAGEVTVAVADDSVVEITAAKSTETGFIYTLTPKKLSSTTIYAIHEDFDTPLECAVTVTPVGVESVTLDKTSLDLKVGETYSFNPTVSPADATSPVLTWKSDNEEVVTVDNGKVTAVREGTATVTVTCQGKSAGCAVSVAAVKATSLTLSMDGKTVGEKTLSVNEKFKLDAVLLPEEVSYKTVEWSVSEGDVVSCEAIVIGGETVSAYVTALKAGAATVTAKIAGETGELTASVNVSVQQGVRPSTEPKIGDYFYSDGTWSDGGLISINADGTEAKWLTGLEKPAPDPSKTVIGIVFQTDQSRISDEEKALGYTHGLVLSLKRAYKPLAQKDPNNKYETPDSLTKFSTGESLELTYIKRSKLGTAYYGTIDGYATTNKIRENNQDDDLAYFPAVDWATRGFVPAPSGTSGWYLPASGQAWDLFANLGGNEVAEYLNTLKTYDNDVTYLDELNPTYDPVAELNSRWALVPSSMKENMYGDRDRSGYLYFMLLTCDQYDSECSRVFWVGSAKDKTADKQGQFQPFVTHINDATTCYPILSF